MAIKHRKLFPEPDFNQTALCQYDCTYPPEIYWPPEPPPLPPPPATNHGGTNSHISPYVIIMVTLLGSALLFISYYLIMVRYCTRYRQSPATQVAGEPEDEDNWPEVDHPIWYITTVGLQPAVINSITVVKFKKGESLIESTDCSVCLNEFQDEETLRLLPKCNHAFHIPCIDTWLRSHTNCPVCRAGILTNSLNMISCSNDQDIHGFDSNRNTQMENSQNAEIGGELDVNCVEGSEIGENRGEIGDEKREFGESKLERIVVIRRSISMDSIAEITFTEESDGSSSSSNAEMHDLRTRTRTRRMMNGGLKNGKKSLQKGDVLMKRSCSYGGGDESYYVKRSSINGFFLQ